MKNKIIPLFISLGFLIVINCARGGTFSDDFSKGLDASYWGVVQSISNFYIVDVSQGDVRLTKGSTANPGGLQNVTIYLNLALFGGRITNDFSVQIDYSNAVVSGPGLDQVELHTIYQDGSIYYIVYDHSRDYNVHVWDGYSESGITAVSQNYGTFRIARTNDVVTAYFNDTPIYSQTRSSPLTGISFVLQNNQGSDDNISVTFDNFSLTSDSVSPPLLLTIEANNGQINLTWPTGLGAKLQMNNLLGITGWMDYSGFVSDINGTNTVTITPSGDKMFFRLQKN